jgi:Protein of unknown function (DUF3892)
MSPGPRGNPVGRSRLDRRVRTQRLLDVGLSGQGGSYIFGRMCSDHERKTPTMTTRVEIQCITKRDRDNPHERIEGVGGVHGGKPWFLPEDQAIAGVKNGTYSFFTNVNGRMVDVIVATHNRREYLKTVADGYEPNNLLRLSSCPLRQAA